MATPHEAFIAGVIWAALRQVEVYEILEVTMPEDRVVPQIVLRGRKTGTRVVVTVGEAEV